MSDKKAKQCDCGNVAHWTWYNGKGGIGTYCDSCARDELPKESDLESYKDPLTTQEMLKRYDTAALSGGGIAPLNGNTPVIRSEEAFDRWMALHHPDRFKKVTRR